MALSWLLHSACHIVGYPSKDSTNIQQGSHAVGYPCKQEINGVIKSTKPITSSVEFQMPLHYPRYSKADYEKMEEWRLDLLLMEYGLNFKGTLEDKRSFAMGAFLWPDQYWSPNTRSWDGDWNYYNVQIWCASWVKFYCKSIMLSPVC